MPTLECSSAGDKRFSAFYARIQIGQNDDSIENFYQLAKRFILPPRVPATWQEGKGRRPDWLVLDGRRYSADDRAEIYQALWDRYLDAHPDLVEYAKQFDAFTDKFATKGGVSQATAIGRYLKGIRSTVELP